MYTPIDNIGVEHGMITIINNDKFEHIKTYDIRTLDGIKIWNKKKQKNNKTYPNGTNIQL